MLQKVLVGLKLLSLRLRTIPRNGDGVPVKISSIDFLLPKLSDSYHYVFLVAQRKWNNLCLEKCMRTYSPRSRTLLHIISEKRWLFSTKRLESGGSRKTLSTLNRLVSFQFLKSLPNMETDGGDHLKTLWP